MTSGQIIFGEMKAIFSSLEENYRFGLRVIMEIPRNAFL
jgi:hypothetical protein